MLKPLFVSPHPVTSALLGLLICMLALAYPAHAADGADQTPTAPILRIDPGEDTAKITRIATDAAGR